MKHAFQDKIRAEETRRAAVERERQLAHREAYKHKLEQARRAAQEANRQAAQQPRQPLAGDMITPFLSLFGGDLVQDYEGEIRGALNALDALQRGPQALPVPQALPQLPKFTALPKMSFPPLPEFPLDGDYCGCVVRAAFADQINTGLFSASLRLWKPAAISQLDQFENELVKSKQCGHPDA